MNEYVKLFARYFVLLAIGILNFFLAEKGLFYSIFTPLTVYPAFHLLDFFYSATLIDSTTIYIQGFYASIVPACIAGSAYYLLLILNLSTPMPALKRLYSMVFLWGLFLIINTLRIVFFSSLLFKGYQYFDIAHLATWYVGSTFLVLMLWFISVAVFKLESIPFYTDLVNIYSSITQDKS